MSEMNIVYEQANSDVATLHHHDLNDDTSEWEPSEDDWETYKDEILALFRKKKLSKVKEAMKRHYGFSASTNAYKKHIYKVWRDVKKYNSQDDMLAMARILVDRARNGDETLFELNGKAYHKDEIQRYFDRKRMSIKQGARRARLRGIGYPQGLRYTFALPILSKTLVPDDIPHLEWLKWNAAKYGRSAFLSDFEARRQILKSNQYSENTSRFKDLLKRAMELMDDPSRQLFISYAPTFKPSQWDTIFFEEGVLFYYVLCLGLTSNPTTPKALIHLCRGLAGFLIAEARSFNPDLVELMKGLPACEPSDIVNVLDTLFESRSEVEVVSSGEHGVAGYVSYQKKRLRLPLQTQIWGTDSLPPYYHNSSRANILKYVKKGLQVAVKHENQCAVDLVASALFRPEFWNSHELSRVVNLLKFFTVSVEWNRNRYPLMTLTQLLTNRYLYQVDNDRFGADDIRALYWQQKIELEVFECVGELPLTTRQDQHPLHRGLGILWLDAVTSKEGQDIVVKPGTVECVATILKHMHFRPFDQQ